MDRKAEIMIEVLTAEVERLRGQVDPLRQKIEEQESEIARLLPLAQQSELHRKDAERFARELQKARAAQSAPVVADKPKRGRKPKATLQERADAMWQESQARVAAEANGHAPSAE